jgi:hypothetical protein
MMKTCADAKKGRERSGHTIKRVGAESEEMESEGPLTFMFQSTHKVAPREKSVE